LIHLFQFFAVAAVAVAEIELAAAVDS